MLKNMLFYTLIISYLFICLGNVNSVPVLLDDEDDGSGFNSLTERFKTIPSWLLSKEEPIILPTVNLDRFTTKFPQSNSTLMNISQEITTKFPQSNSTLMNISQEITTKFPQSNSTLMNISQEITTKFPQSNSTLMNISQEITTKFPQSNSTLQKSSCDPKVIINLKSNFNSFKIDFLMSIRNAIFNLTNPTLGDLNLFIMVQNSLLNKCLDI